MNIYFGRTAFEKERPRFNVWMPDSFGMEVHTPPGCMLITRTPAKRKRKEGTMEKLQAWFYPGKPKKMVRRLKFTIRKNPKYKLIYRFRKQYDRMKA